MDGSAPPAASAASIAATGDNLFRRYERWLRAALRRRHGRDLADDVTSETIMRVASQVAAGKVHNPKGLLLKVARDLIIDRIRGDRVGALTTPTDDTVLARHSTPATQEATLTLKQIVLALPPELRDVFVLKNIEGLSYQEIADVLGIPYTTVNHRLRLAFELTAAAMRPGQAHDD